MAGRREVTTTVPLGALDALFLHLETAATPMHVGALHLLDAPAGGGDLYDAVRRHLAARLAVSPLFTRRLRRLPLDLANPVWIDGEVDLNHHLQRLRLPAPGSQHQLWATVARLHAQPLERSRPLWRFHLIEGLAGGGCAFYSKVHHAAIDGAAGVALAQLLLDAQPAAAPVETAAAPPPERPPEPGRLQLLASALARQASAGAALLRRAPALARAGADLLRAGGGTPLAWLKSLRLAPDSPFNRTIDRRRSIATASLPLAPLRAVAAAQGATVNDVVLTVVGGALRRYLLVQGELPAEPLVAAMPVSLRERGDTRMNTQATMAQVGLGTDIAEPLQRLRAIHDAAQAAKAVSRAMRPALDLPLPSLGMPWLLGAAAALYGAGRLVERLPRLANVVVSNVPGPAAPLYLAGAQLRSWWPLSIVEHGLGLNVTVMRYLDALDCGLVAAHCLLPDPAELAAAMLASVDELVAAAGLARSAARRRTAALAPRAGVGGGRVPPALPRTGVPRRRRTMCRGTS